MPRPMPLDAPVTMAACFLLESAIMTFVYCLNLDGTHLDRSAFNNSQCNPPERHPLVRVRISASASDCETHRLGLPREDLMVGVHQVDLNFVGARRHPRKVDRIEITSVRPQPRQVIHTYVKMPHPRRYVETALPEHR